MKKHSTLQCTGLISCIIFSQSSCNNTTPVQQTTEPAKKELTHGELVERGKYLVAIIGCNDCHSPKKMSPEGSVPDSGKILSGFPAENHLPAVDKSALKPGGWAHFSQELTATVGPMGYQLQREHHARHSYRNWLTDIRRVH